MRHRRLLVIGITLLPGVAARAEGPLSEEAERAEEAAPLREDNAVSLYVQAAKLITMESPSASALEYPDYPPYGAEWERLAEASWKQNAPVFELVRRARKLDKATWPTGSGYLGRCREVMNVACDGALYQHLRGEDRAAIEIVRDMLHMTDMLRQHLAPNDLVRPLVFTGIDASTMYRLMTIIAGVRLTDDPNDKKALQASDAAALVEQLVKVPTARETLKEVFGDNYDALKDDPSAERAAEHINRVVAERGLAAMSLACHTFRHEHKRWPASLEELSTKMPRVPADPFGDGKQTLGYILLKGVLPDGSDRPLVYCRFNAKDGLNPRPNRPHYGNYFGDDTNRPMSEQKQLGQFRDVARWTPGL
jgi:hypothetical protein